MKEYLQIQCAAFKGRATCTYPQKEFGHSLHIDLKIREYKPLSGSSYIKTPKWISDKKATVNIKNEDQKCFKYCMNFEL